ncbi:MAG TPA: STAS domain-containing protein [Bryobacteraceae bacterium]
MTHALEEALSNLADAGPEMILDLSSVVRVDSDVLKALEKLADGADEKGVKVVLSGVGVRAYKVLKLMRLARRFTFVN